MEDNTREQVEALQALIEYSPKLIAGLKNVAEELSGHRQPDTDEYLKSVIDGMNWEIQVVNGTLAYLNEKELRVNKQEANELFVRFSELYASKDEWKISEWIKNKLVPFFVEIEAIAKERTEI